MRGTASAPERRLLPSARGDAPAGLPNVGGTALNLKPARKFKPALNLKPALHHRASNRGGQRVRHPRFLRFAALVSSIAVLIPAQLLSTQPAGAAGDSS